MADETNEGETTGVEPAAEPTGVEPAATGPVGEPALAEPPTAEQPAPAVATPSDGRHRWSRPQLIGAGVGALVVLGLIGALVAALVSGDDGSDIRANGRGRHGEVWRDRVEERMQRRAERRQEWRDEVRGRDGIPGPGMGMGRPGRGPLGGTTDENGVTRFTLPDGRIVTISPPSSTTGPSTSTAPTTTAPPGGA